MDNLFLLATLTGTRIAVEGREVEAVVRLHDISPVVDENHSRWHELMRQGSRVAR